MASSILEENSLFLQILQRIVDANAALNRTVAVLMQEGVFSIYC